MMQRQQSMQQQTFDWTAYVFGWSFLFFFFFFFFFFSFLLKKKTSQG